jgi:putative hydrolase of the HAD superfamily
MIPVNQAQSYLESRSDDFVPLSVVKTDMVPFFQTDNSIKAVLFDIYGTLLISEAGDIGLSALDQGEDHLIQIETTEGQKEIGYNKLKSMLFHRISYYHEMVKKKDVGIVYPEVDIITLWSDIFHLLGFRDYNIDDLLKASIAFEIFSNKVWLMPGALSLIEFLRVRRMPLGIVSNAQFYTPLLFEFLSGLTLDRMGFQEEYISWSYEKKCGKPDPLIFRDPLDELKRLGIKSHEILYVGNDMLNDIATASALGLKTALFAGDQRSLRMREQDSRVIGVKADYIITELGQLEVVLMGGVDD